MLTNIRKDVQSLKKTTMLHTNLWEATFINKNLLLVDFPDKILLQTFSIGEKAITYEYNEALRQHYITGFEFPKEVTFSAHETASLVMKKCIEDWKGAYITKENTFKVGVNPTIDIEIALQKFNPASTLDPFGLIPQMVNVGRFLLKNVRFQSMSEWGLDYESGDPVKVEVTCSVDDIEFTGASTFVSL
jgi:hypothetical protein